MKLNTYKINKTSSPIYKTPNIKNPIETEGVYGEIFLVQKIKNDFAFGVLQIDNYKGWIKLDDLKQVKLNNNYKVIYLNTLIKDKPDLKSITLGNLSFGSQISVIKKENEWSSFKFYYKGKLKIGFIYSNHIYKLHEKLKKNWIDLVENFINVPYKWGGRSFFGVDCSSLIQLSIIVGKNKFFPRNSYDQYLFSRNHGEITTKTKRGTLVFWKDHVGLMLSNENIIHANAFHMKVEIEPLLEAKKRIEKNYSFLNYINLNY